jgi:hypothetical protein
MVDYISLSEEEKTCYICQEDFSEQISCLDTSKPAMEALLILDILPYRKLKDIGCDEPIRLPCNHVFGSSCLQRWLGENGNSCPLCRLQLCARGSEWDLEEEFARRQHALLHLPFRSLLNQEMCNESTILLNEESARKIKDQLVVRMIEFVLRLQRLPPLPDFAIALAKCYDAEWLDGYEHAPAYLACVNKVIPKDATKKTAYQVSRGMILDPTIQEAHARLCTSLDILVYRKCNAHISPRILLRWLLSQSWDISIPVRYKRVMRISLQVTIEFESRAWGLEQEYLKKLERMEEEEESDEYDSGGYDTDED